MFAKDLPICIIEDNKPIRKLFCTLLQKSGFQVADFPDGTSGMDWLKANRPLAVITDILLPDVNGSDVLALIRTLNEGDKIPVIAVTGFAQANDRDKFIALGFDSYIPKPINTSSFVSEVTEIIDVKLS